MQDKNMPVWVRWLSLFLPAPSEALHHVTLMLLLELLKLLLH